MSYDLAVWHTVKRLSNEQATALYAELCESNTDGVSPTPAIEAFYAELTARHPEIHTIPEDQIDDIELCPWSGGLERSPGHVLMSCVWPKADYVQKLVYKLARKHGLTLYNPQEDRVYYPKSVKPKRSNRGKNRGA